MEQNRESQQPTAFPPAYPTPQQPYYPPSPVARPGRWLRLRRTIRLLLRRLLYGAAVLGRALRPYAAFIFVIVALLGVIGWMSFMLWGPKESPPAFSRAESLPPTSAIESFIRGQQNFNADVMWEAFSSDYQAQQLASGASKATLQSRANSERSMGLKYVHYDYIGGIQANSGSMYFYSVDLTLQNQRGRFPIVFIADADGKITEIDSPLTRLGQSSGGQ